MNEAESVQNKDLTATSLNNLASLLKATNLLSEAELPMAQALVIFHASLGNEHPNTQTVMRNYQLLLQAMGLTEDEAIGKIQSKLKGNAQ